ncbi:MAG: patatin-like phospholipase family protein [bacterium]
MADAATFLDELRPFRRGEIALARRAVGDPMFMLPLELECLRYAIRLAQLSSIGPEPDALIDRIGSFRLRLLQLLAPVLPTEPERIDARDLHALLPKVVRLVDEARAGVIGAGLADEAALDAEIAHKRLVLVLGGAAGSGYVFLGALVRLEELGLRPAYQVGCSIGSLLGVIRGRRLDFDLEELLEDIRLLRATAVFRPARLFARFGLPAALRLDLHRGLGALFTNADGEPLRLRELAIPTDVLATGLGAGALLNTSGDFARMVDAELSGAEALRELPGSVLVRAVSALVALAMSRRALVPVFFGADPETAELPALDAAGFSTAIPALLQYDLEGGDSAAVRILARIFAEHRLTALVDGSVASIVPARYAFEAIEAGRIGTRNTLIVALDALASSRGANAIFTPALRALAGTAHRDKPFWDLHVAFRRPPPLLDLFPSEGRLRSVTTHGEREFEPTARLLRALLAPLRPWRELRSAS